MYILILFLCISATSANAQGYFSPGCNGDRNAISTPCGDPCPITCDNKDNTGPRICPAICIPNGCACKTGYVRNKDGKCILPKDCPAPTCPGPNEIYSACKNPCQSCSDLSGCLALPIARIPGCNCLNGYARNADGVCIEELQCPCSDPNAERVECPNPCPRTCDNLSTYKTIVCPRLCLRQGCTCKKGFVFNSNGKCVEPSQCCE